MLTGRGVGHRRDGPPDGATLRELVLGFLAAQEQPSLWSFFPANGAGWAARRPHFLPDIVLDVGGRIAYVEVRRQGGGPLPPPRRAGLALARCRGAPCFVVRSLPEMERVLRRLGVPLRPPRGLVSPRGDCRQSADVHLP